MKFSLSTNIKNVQYDDFHYIVTANARKVLGTILTDYFTGIHSFILVGTYGSGKSSFIVALERDLLLGTNFLFDNKGQFNNYKKFKCINVIGDYNSLTNLLREQLESESTNSKELFTLLNERIIEHKKKGEFVVLVIDEFGKVLEHAANHNPEKELYFLQQLAEFVNHPKHDNIILLTTLHQNFGAYSKKLTEIQRNEWAKVKGRFIEIVFSEPVEQLLYLAAEQIETSNKQIVSRENFDNIVQLAKETKFVNNNFNIKVAESLYPLDILSATVLTQAIQRYGQNERSLFTFLHSKDQYSLSNFEPTATLTYNLAYVYDYILYNFHSYLSEVNADSANWRAMRVALERIEALFEIEEVETASKIVKVVGLCNLFGSSVTFDDKALTQYLQLALNIENPKNIIEQLVAYKIIRFAKYKSQYVIFEGTDINLEDELYKATGVVPRPIDFIDELNAFFEFKVVQANEIFYKIGTPRFFEFVVSDKAKELYPVEDIDGYINLVFPRSDSDKEHLIETSLKCKNAVIYVCFNNVSQIVDHLYEIDKLEYIRNHIIDEDNIAEKEIQNQILFEKDMLNQAINHNLISYSEEVEWYYKGERKTIISQLEFNKLLSTVCNDIYFLTPVVQNELFNKHKVNSAVSQARGVLLNLLLDDSCVILEDLGMDKDKFPPEKTIYYSLLKNTGVHSKSNGIYTLGAPTSDFLKSLWKKCEDFFESTIEAPRKIGDLVKDLKSAPFKLKQGFIDFWVPIFLIIKKQDYSLYDNEGRYLPNLNKEILDLIQKYPNDFKIKAFAIEGVKIEFFNKYRNFINLNDKDLITQDSFLETIKPFFVFYNSLNEFTKNTNTFDNPLTSKFRNVLAQATDPEKTFFEDLPAVFGFENEDLASNQEFLNQYQDLLKGAVRELRLAYPNLIKRIEDSVIAVLDLKSNVFNEYKLEIENLFKYVRTDLLSNKQKSFLNRLLIRQPDRTLWYESISYVIINKPLASIKDSEIVFLIDSLKYLLKTLIKFIDVSKTANNIESEVYNFELISTNGNISPKTYVLPDSKVKKASDLENKINELLSGDTNLDICALLKVLQKKLNENS